MNLQPIANNQNAIHFPNGTSVFFSYRTPVAAHIDGKYIRTAKKWSVTTTRHISKWLDGVDAELVDQAVLDTLVDDTYMSLVTAWSVKAGGQVQILAHALPLTESG